MGEVAARGGVEPPRHSPALLTAVGASRLSGFPRHCRAAAVITTPTAHWFLTLTLIILIESYLLYHEQCAPGGSDVFHDALFSGIRGLTIFIIFGILKPYMMKYLKHQPAKRKKLSKAERERISRLKAAIYQSHGRYFEDDFICECCHMKYRFGWHYNSGIEAILLCTRCKLRLKPPRRPHIILTPMNG